MNNKRKKIILTLCIFSALFLTLGITLTFFDYIKDGTTENSIKSGSVTFWYDEQERQGNSIGIEDALPMSDTDGKAQNDAFNFRIVSNTSSTITIPYMITLRQKEGTDDIGNIIKVYLAKTSGYDASVASENEVVTSKFSSLTDITKNGYSEKVLYEDQVPASSSNYNQNYRLKMWVDNSIDYNDSAYINKTFTVMVNVYADADATQTTNSTIPTIESCPGCRFLFTTNSYSYRPGYASTLTVDDTKENYNDVVAESGRQYFIGVILSDGDHGTIQRAFSCGIKGEEPNQGTAFCIEGILDTTFGGNSIDNSNIYARNRELLNTIYGPYDSNTSTGCNTSSGIHCSGSVGAYIGAEFLGLDNGSGSSYCDILDNGSFSCH